MKEERKKILEMVKSGLLSIDEAEKLLEELNQVEEKKQMKEEASKEAEKLSTIIEAESEKEDQYEKKHYDYKVKQEKTLKDRVFDFFETAMEKVKELDLDFTKSVNISHVFQQNNNDFQKVQIDIPNGSVHLEAWDHTDVRVECDAKIFRTDQVDEGKERFMKDVDFTIVDETLTFVSFDKINKVEVKVYVPQKDFDKVYVKLFNGSITTRNLSARKISLQSTNGQIRLSNASGEKAKLETTNGAITLSEIAFDKVDVETVNGKVNVDGKFKKAEAETIGGSITAYVREPQPESVRLSSATGAIYVNVQKHLAVSGEVKSNLGNVHVNLENIYKMKEEKEVIQKIIRFDTTSELTNKTYIFADAKTGSVYVKPL
ncbi:DUF4097 family beta strand repeat-containing protein [Caldibacillus thermolactis]|uniref:DUF4097 family beta strand repeat-containing protein n=1 Tax=Pallidibacillus thermolactis TaxID=251051 RepID=A0ABT2WEI4_9BACI|nr:DUF4097 family beta strand repeat-containing protein [Pallidibacillus thermolactis]MCU9593219.1 DUF4097 family beta strand repeat-containing protein [Pallidibacillus thermolactis]